MSLTLQDIDRLAHLSRLGVSENEKSRMVDELNDFFDVVEKIQHIDTTNILPMAHAVEMNCEISLRLHDDVVTEAVDRPSNQHSAPNVQDGFYIVPKVIE
jgi:aspartyl-tRNA(Asn)/glutamyl-tRNA(Gln) amidotransferase subunit C